jgi:hypothetical protein
MRRIAPALAGLLLAATATGAHATSDSTRCLLGRYKAAGKYAYCFQQGVSHDGFGGLDDRLAKCRLKYVLSWSRLALKSPASSCALPRLVDNGDGTITDRMTHLQWEKKTGDDGATNPADPHDVDNVYSWSTGVPSLTAANGTIFTSFLPALNGGACFAGHCDWRLPTFAELRTLVDDGLCGASPSCIDPIFTPNGDSYYSGTTRSDDGPGTSTWSVEFTGAVSFSFVNTSGAHVRAVREGY